MSERTPKLVLGVVLARWPRASAGNVCAVMHWALGFRELGWDVWIAEHLNSEEVEQPASSDRASPQEEFWNSVVEEFDFASRNCLLIEGDSPRLEAFREFARGADLFINFAGHFRHFELFGSQTVKAYLDVDPGFTQLWVEVFHQWCRDIGAENWGPSQMSLRMPPGPPSGTGMVTPHWSGVAAGTEGSVKALSR